MTEIRNRGQGSIADVQRDRRNADEALADLVRDLKKDSARIGDLVRVQVHELGPEGHALLARTIAQELRGQLPPQLFAALMNGQLGPEQLQGFLGRLGNALNGDAQQRTGMATTPDAARAQATDTSMPQQALRWTQFVQRAQHVPGSGVTQDRAGSAAPKGEGAALLELLGQSGRGLSGAGLRSPKLVERGMADLSPGQRDLLMKAAFGEKLAGKLRELGVGDPLALVKAGALPKDRAALAEALGMDRGALLSLLMKTELLKIGGGKNGEVGIRPDLLGPLGQAGIAMLGTLAVLRAMPRDELSLLYGLLRRAAGGFENTMKGQRAPMKRDVVHWAKTAARRPSDILLAEWDEKRGGLSRGDAQELIAAWYQENLLWDALARAKREAVEQNERDRERRDERQRERERDDDNEREQERAAELEMQYDHEREDRLMCFWVTDYNTNPALPEAMRRMYVCIDPDSGAIIPQTIEAELLPKG